MMFPAYHCMVSLKTWVDNLPKGGTVQKKAFFGQNVEKKQIFGENKMKIQTKSKYALR